MASVNQIEISFSLLGGIRCDEQVNAFVGFCPRLKLYSQGRTLEEAKAALTSAIHGYVKNVFKIGMLNEVLKESGFGFLSGAVEPSAYSDAEWISLKDRKFDAFDVMLRMPMSNVLQAPAA